MIDMFVYVADIALILHNSNSMTSPCYIQKVIANVQKIKGKLVVITFISPHWAILRIQQLNSLDTDWQI